MNLPCPVPTLPAFAPCCCLSCTGQPTALQRTATAILDTGGKAWASARSRILEIDSRELFEEVERQELGRHRARTTLVVALRDRRMTLPQMQPDGDPTVESIRGIASARDRLADLLESVETVTGVPWLEMDGTIRAKADWFDALLDAWAGFGPDNATTVADVAAALRTIRLLCREQG